MVIIDNGVKKLIITQITKTKNIQKYDGKCHRKSPVKQKHRGCVIFFLCFYCFTCKQVFPRAFRTYSYAFKYISPFHIQFFIIIIILEYFFPLFMCEHEHCHTNFPFTIKEFTLLLLYFEFIRKLVFYTQAV